MTVELTVSDIVHMIANSDDPTENAKAVLAAMLALIAVEASEEDVFQMLESFITEARAYNEHDREDQG